MKRNSGFYIELTIYDDTGNASRELSDRYDFQSENLFSLKEVTSVRKFITDLEKIRKRRKGYTY